MNKVININFQGRVIPIEEPAYEELKQYVESLRQYFSKEEGKEEIINDIENRIAELFGEKLKTAGTNFISEAHVAAIIASIGRPEQFDEVVMDDNTNSSTSTSSTASTPNAEPRGSLYRNANEKMLGGVCSGLGAYLRIDTTIIRVLFAMLAVGSFGFGLVLYIVLWAILPERFMNNTAVTRKLYRDPEQKVLGGVCSGISQYFSIAVWIPRLVFALPFVLGAFEGLLGWVHFRGAISLPFGTMFLVYVILWAVVPKAVTASEKMEMRGEKVDLESIKNKVKEEMQGVKSNISENAGRWKQEAKESANRLANEAGPAFRKSGNGFFRFIGTAVKVFFSIVAGIIAISLIAAAFGMFMMGNLLMPLKNFLVNSESIQWYAWGTLFLFVLVPIIAIIQWLVRSMIGHRTKTPWIGITLGVLWTLGWVSLVMLVASISKQFRRMGSVREEVAITQPTNGRMMVGFRQPAGQYYPLDLNYSIDDDDFNRDVNGIKLSKSEDSLLMSNIRIKLERSRDDQFHVTMVKRARAESAAEAETFAAQVSYAIAQSDSVLTLPMSFPITTATRFRNQQVIVQIEVPVGKEIYIDGKADDLHYFSVRGGSRGLNIQINDDEEDEGSWRSGVWYIMKEGGVEKKFKDQYPDTEKMEMLEDRIREEIRKENDRIENLDIKVKEGDTTVNISIKGDEAAHLGQSGADETVDQVEMVGTGILPRAGKLFRTAMMLLKIR